jgi:hypothetical protein
MAGVMIMTAMMKSDHYKRTNVSIGRRMKDVIVWCGHQREARATMMAGLITAMRESRHAGTNEEMNQ